MIGRFPIAKRISFGKAAALHPKRESESSNQACGWGVPLQRRCARFFRCGFACVCVCVCLWRFMCLLAPSLCCCRRRRYHCCMHASDVTWHREMKREIVRVLTRMLTLLLGSALSLPFLSSLSYSFAFTFLALSLSRLRTLLSLHRPASESSKHPLDMEKDDRGPLSSDFAVDLRRLSEVDSFLSPYRFPSSPPPPPPPSLSFTPSFTTFTSFTLLHALLPLLLLLLLLRPQEERCRGGLQCGDIERALC